MSGQPLNQSLFGLLTRVFGRVVVAKPGEAAVGAYAGSATGLTRYALRVTGEYYRVNCPYCGDSRRRLWVHHLWGRGPGYAAANGRIDDMWWAVICHNEDCLSNYAARQDLRRRVYSSIGRDVRRSAPVLRGSVEPDSLSAATLPGTCLRVDQLPDDHPAVDYLAGRRFDVGALGRDYGICYCAECEAHPVAEGRVVAPVSMRGELVGWQARTIGHDAKRKYYNSPGMAKRLMLYGMDPALALSMVVVVEGVTDVWRMGPGAVSLLGKTMSREQLELLIRNWEVVVLFLDADAYESGIDAHSQLRRSVRTVVATPPPGADPAAMEYEYAWQLVEGACRSEGVDMAEMLSHAR